MRKTAVFKKDAVIIQDSRCDDLWCRCKHVWCTLMLVFMKSCVNCNKCVFWGDFVFSLVVCSYTIDLYVSICRLHAFLLSYRVLWVFDITPKLHITVIITFLLSVDFVLFFLHQTTSYHVLSDFPWSSLPSGNQSLPHLPFIQSHMQTKESLLLTVQGWLQPCLNYIFILYSRSWNVLSNNPRPEPPKTR